MAKSFADTITELSSDAVAFEEALTGTSLAKATAETAASQAQTATVNAAAATEQTRLMVYGGIAIGVLFAALMGFYIVRGK